MKASQRRQQVNKAPNSGRARGFWGRIVGKSSTKNNNHNPRRTKSQRSQRRRRIKRQHLANRR